MYHTWLLLDKKHLIVNNPLEKPLFSIEFC